MIEVKDLSFGFEGRPVLKHVSLKIERGEFVGLMGPNGGGKTTFLRLLMGFLSPQKGKIVIQGKSPIEARLSIGYVPQSHRTDRDFPITLFELVLLGAVSKITPLSLYPKEIKEKALGLIEQLGLMAHRNQSFGSLSGGLAQRALLARSLLSDPEILLLDEPTTNTDAPSTQIFFRLLEQMKGVKTILMVTHDLNTIIERVDRVLCVQGQVNSFLPTEVCGHFALGLYHTPLLGSPHNHLKAGLHAVPR